MVSSFLPPLFLPSSPLPSSSFCLLPPAFSYLFTYLLTVCAHKSVCVCTRMAHTYVRELNGSRHVLSTMWVLECPTQIVGLWQMPLPDPTFSVPSALLFKMFICVYECFVCRYASVSCVRLEPIEVRRSPGTGVSSQQSCEWPWGCWEPNPCCLEEQQALDTTEPSFPPVLSTFPIELSH